MEKLSELIEKNPKLRSNKSEYLKLAVKEGNAVRGTGPHEVKLVGCENATNKDYQTQKEVKGVNLLFEENGERKKYFVPILGNDNRFHYLIERFAGIGEGTELVLEYKRKEGSVRGFIDVQVAGEQEVEQLAGEEEKIPIIEDSDEAPSGDIEPGHNLEVEGEEPIQP